MPFDARASECVCVCVSVDACSCRLQNYKGVVEYQIFSVAWMEKNMLISMHISWPQWKSQVLFLILCSILFLSILFFLQKINNFFLFNYLKNDFFDEINNKQIIICLQYCSMAWEKQTKLFSDTPTPSICDSMKWKETDKQTVIDEIKIQIERLHCFHVIIAWRMSNRFSRDKKLSKSASPYPSFWCKQIDE